MARGASRSAAAYIPSASVLMSVQGPVGPSPTQEQAVLEVERRIVASLPTAPPFFCDVVSSGSPNSAIDGWRALSRAAARKRGHIFTLRRPERRAWETAPIAPIRVICRLRVLAHTCRLGPVPERPGTAATQVARRPGAGRARRRAPRAVASAASIKDFFRIRTNN